MRLQRVDRLKEPPVVGQHYLVPLVRGVWHGMLRDWPVIGLKHDDAEFLNFSIPHYHIDTRFLRARNGYVWKAPFAPLHDPWSGSTPGTPPLGKPFFRRRKCLRAQHIFIGPTKFMWKLEEGFKGRQCASGKRGFVCPHKQFPLGSTPAIDGVITCPLHGLRIEASTGLVLGASMR